MQKQTNIQHNWQKYFILTLELARPNQSVTFVLISIRMNVWKDLYQENNTDEYLNIQLYKQIYKYIPMKEN